MNAEKGDKGETSETGRVAEHENASGLDMSNADLPGMLVCCEVLAGALRT
jgi:hypothetical protein